ILKKIGAESSVHQSTEVGGASRKENRSGLLFHGCGSRGQREEKFEIGRILHLKLDGPVCSVVSPI
ncbi:MAG TPA: hypothetical protein VMB70_12025, partial [Terriglobia bacterium]|nr:hypothetical protein [Terriglobia bacterium]